MERAQADRGKITKKRKAESQDNDRLSKRLSLLNLERNGSQKLYVPVQAAPQSPKPFKSKAKERAIPDDDIMQLDDTKHKVYIYNLDDELSDSDASEDGKLVFLPDIEKHLLDTRIPPSILASDTGELAGMNNQLVLYNIPSSLTVPEEEDSVRRVIAETRARARANQQQKQLDVQAGQLEKVLTREDLGFTNSMLNGSTSATEVIADDDDSDAMDLG